MDTKECKICKTFKNKIKFHGRICFDCFNQSRRKVKSTYKICKKCLFAGDKSNFAGKLCAICEIKRKKEYYKNNREKIILKAIKYASQNREKVNFFKKKYKDMNKEKVKECGRIYYKNNKEKYFIYRNENKDKLRINSRKYKKNRRMNFSLRLRENISTIIRAALKRNYGSKRGASCLNYLPYSINDLKNYLENQFEAWMTWDNWGCYMKDKWNNNDQSTWTWNIDHIIPQSNLPYSSMEDENFKKCWALENLRPYSAKQNIIDGSRKGK